jgi:twin BRCT domain
LFAIGAKYDEYLGKETSLLICKSSNKSDKLTYAWDRDIPAVSLDWLLDSISAGKSQQISQYTFINPKAVVDIPTVDPKENGAEIIQVQGAPVRDDGSQDEEESEHINGAEESKAFDGNRLQSNPELELPQEIADSEVEPSVVSLPPIDSVLEKSPLSEIQPDVNSPKKVEDETPQISNEQIAELIRLQQEKKPQPQPQQGRGRGLRKFIGRVASNLSAGSGVGADSKSLSNSRASSVTVEDNTVADNSIDTNRVLKDLGHRFTQTQNTTRDDAAPPSQALDYKDPEVEEHRERMARKLNGQAARTPKKAGRMVETGGVAKDGSAVKRRSSRNIT